MASFLCQTLVWNWFCFRGGGWLGSGEIPTPSLACLAYFWVGSQNGVQLQLWATWLRYAVLVDLTDVVAEKLDQPFAAISMEMVYRSLYYFTQAYHRGEALDPVAYLATNAKWLGVLKRKDTQTPNAFEKSFSTFR